MKQLIDRAGQLWEVDLSGHENHFTRVVVVETIRPSGELPGPGALRFINHRCLVVEKDDDTEALKHQVRKLGFQLVLVEDLENSWDAKRRPIADPNPPPFYKRLA